MGLAPKIVRSDLRKYMDAKLQRINAALIMELQNIGETIVNHARDIDASTGFTDRSGNLRASIGYVIYLNGRPYTQNFKDNVGPDGNNGEGRKAGERLANKVASTYSDGIVLVVVAGMNYAHYVESKNRDVLASAENLAEILVPKMQKQLSKNINRMK